MQHAAHWARRVNLAGHSDPVSLRTENWELNREQPASFSACGLPGGLFGID